MTFYIKNLIILVFLLLIIPMSTAVGPIPDTKEKYPSWSPDGQKILFDSTGVMSEGIFIVRPDGSELQKMASEEWDASWSSDGTKIILIKNFYINADFVNGSHEIALLDVKTHNITRITYNKMKESKPKFSTDGHKIVFEAGNAIHIMNSDGTELKKLVDSARFPKLSPDGKKVVYRYYKPNSIWVMNPDGTDKKKVFDDYKYSFSSNFRWTIDSRYLLLNNRSNVISKININDPTDIEYIYDPVAHWDPEYSPDGNYITFVSNMDGGRHDLFVARSNGSDLYRIVFDTNPRLLNAIPDYFYKKSRPAPPPWPTPEPTVVKTPAVTPTTTGTTAPTPEVPGFSLLAGIVSLTLLVLLKRIKK